MAKKPEISKLPTKEEYDVAVGSAELLDVKLIESSFTVAPFFFGSDREELNFSYQCDLSRSHYQAEDGRLIGTFKLEAGCKKSRTWALRNKATFLVAFDLSGAPTEDAALLYLQRVGAFACYPYFRGHFAHVCAEAGADVPPLPIMKGNLPKKIGPALDSEKSKVKSKAKVASK